MTSKIVESAWANIGFFLYQLDTEIRKLVRRLECLNLKILKKKRCAIFNQTCCVCIYIYIYIISKKEANDYWWSGIAAGIVIYRNKETKERALILIIIVQQLVCTAF